MGAVLFLALLYPLTLSSEARGHFLKEGGLPFFLFLLSGLGVFGKERLAPWAGLVAAAGLRALWVLVGQWQGLGL